MSRGSFLARLATAVSLSLSGCAAPPVVTEVPSGDELVLSDGRRVKYAGVAAPRPGEPLFEESRAANQSLVQDRQIEILEAARQPEDPPSDLAAFVYAPVQEGEKKRFLWVQGELALFGFVRVVPAPPGASHAELHQNLETLEGQARSLERGIWAKPNPVAPGR